MFYRVPSRTLRPLALRRGGSLLLWCHLVQDRIYTETGLKVSEFEVARAIDKGRWSRNLGRYQGWVNLPIVWKDEPKPKGGVS